MGFDMTIDKVREIPRIFVIYYIEIWKDLGNVSFTVQNSLGELNAGAHVLHTL